MSISCSCDFDWDGEGWMWDDMSLMIMPPFGRRKRCGCCKKLINWGEEVYRYNRVKEARTDIEERIHGDLVTMPPWFTCETCSDLISALEGGGACWNWGEPIADQIAQYREAEREARAAEIEDGKEPGSYDPDEFM